MVKLPEPHTGGSEFDIWVWLHFPAKADAAMHQVMTQVIGYLPPVCKTWVERHSLLLQVILG